MTTKFTSFLAALAMIVALVATPVQAQTSAANRGNVLGFNDAADYGQWVFRSTAAVASGAQTATIQGDAFANTRAGRTFLPLATTNPVIVDQENSSLTETVTPSAVTCTTNSLQSTCTFTATFSNAHNPGFSIRSATYGICE